MEVYEMIKIVTSAERHTSNKGSIHSEFSFSFADYEDPSNAHFSCMLAHNDNELNRGRFLKDIRITIWKLSRM
jgi:hypothetical protein